MELFKILILILFPCCVTGQVANIYDTLKSNPETLGATTFKTDSVKFIKLKPFHFITNIPYDIVQMAEAPFKKSNLKGLMATTLVTAILIPVDQSVTDGVTHFGRQLDIKTDSKYKTLIRVGKTNVFKVPQNIDAFLYQLGEGGTSMMIAAGLYVYGKASGDKRSLYAASDLSEIFITMGITTQIIKRISGRQSPSRATVKGGEWHFLPSFHKYQTNTPNYDAFPSGHLASMMSTVTMLALDYPEKKWIKPTGITLMSLTSLVMIHDRVHWIGDYPLAIALGYLSAKVTYLKNHQKMRTSTSTNL